MASYKITFGTSGWRERTDSGFNTENVARAAYGIGAYLKKRQDTGVVIVGYDTREHSKEFAEAVCAVLSGEGLDAIVTNAPTPTPVMSFAVKNRKAAGGIIITASHNAAAYNGLKFMDIGGINPSVETTDVITKLIPEDNVAIPEWKPKTTSVKEEYISALGKRFDLEKAKGMRIVIDAIHGAGSGYLSTALKMHGADVIELRSDYRSDFGGIAPVPDEGNLQDLMSMVKSSGADLGIACDGDADRFAIVGNDGKYYTANESGLMMCDYLFGYRKEKGAVAKSIQSTNAIDRLCAKYGVESKEVAVGFKYIAKELTNGAAFGIEGAAQGVAFGNWILDKDGIAAGAFACEMIAVEGMPLSKIWMRVSKEFGYGSFVNFAVEKTQANAGVVKRFAGIKAGERFSGKKVEGISFLDGVKLNLEGDAWVLLRESGTEPLVRAYVETKNKGETDLLAQYTMKFLKAEQ